MPTAAPAIAVIVTSFRDGANLERALCSALDQGYAHREVHVVTDAQDDDTLTMLAMYDGRLASWSTGGDAGPAAAINHTRARTTAELIVVLDAEHVLLPGALEETARAASKHPTAAWFVGDTELLDDHDDFVGRRFHDADATLADLLHHPQGPPPLPACAFRATTLELVGGVDPQFRHAFGDELILRLLDHGLRPAHIPTATAAQHATPQPPLNPQAGAEAHRDEAPGHPASHQPTNPAIAPTLQHHRETLALLHRYADRLAPAQRFTLWQSNQQRKRIHALAESQAQHHPSRASLWAQALQNPWWLADPDYRRHLLHGTPNTAIEQRKAA